MTKKDLKERMVVETRNGNRYLVCGNSIIRDKGYCNFRDYDENLTILDFHELDIVKVYDVVSTLEEVTDPNLELLWERKEHEPKVGDIYCSDGDEKLIIIKIDGSSLYPYLAMNIYKDIYESDVYSKAELLEDYKYLGTDVNIASSFNLAFAKLKDYNHEQI